MRRRVLGLDRFLILLLALVLLVGGAAAIAWTAGWLRQLLPSTPGSLDAQPVADAVAASWWPVASLVAGVVLGLLALWWLVSHRTHRGTGDLRLPGSGSTGAFSLDASAAASAAAEEVAEVLGVRSASGRVLQDRGELVAELSVQLERTADLDAVVAAADGAMGRLGGVVGRDDLRGRVLLSVARSSRRATARVS